jgi:hypothetical protein
MSDWHGVLVRLVVQVDVRLLHRCSSPCSPGSLLGLYLFLVTNYWSSFPRFCVLIPSMIEFVNGLGLFIGFEVMPGFTIQ